MKFCKTCGKSFEEGTVFCSQCGTKLVGVEEKVAENANVVPAVVASADVVTAPAKDTDSAERSEILEETTQWEFSSRFLLRFAKEAKVTANESMLTIQKSFGFIFYVVLNMSKSAPVTVDIRDIKSVTVKEGYSVWAGFFFILALACIRREAYLAMVILALIGYSELKYTKMIINYKGGTIEIGDSNSKTAPSIQGFLNYIRKYNPGCIQEA
jgi:uncharacterized Zn finger protein (UPF0148 family)